MRNLFIAVLTLAVSGVYAQQVQNIRGKIVNEISKRPIESATIQIFQNNEATNYGAASDATGTFIINSVPIGRYKLVFSHVNFKTHIIHEVLVNASRELIFNIGLTESSELLDEVIISSDLPPNDLTMIGKQGISMEQTMRYAGNFFDPARLSTSFPNVIAANDQANNLVIRGNTPNHMIWMLEGANIVNPNHLTNAGTFSDRPAQNGGGVNILSSQILGQSNLLMGSFGPSFGNSLSGIMDMKFKEGNNKNSEFVAQASLLGLEFAGEGPLGKKGASYLFNYRYSTVGLLSLMGVDFGGEAIGFQDIAFKLSLPSGRGKFTFFGMGGLSANEFTGQRDSTAWENDKDRMDISYKGRMGALGLSHQTRIGNKSSLRTIAVYSTKRDERNSDFINNMYTVVPRSLDTLSQRLLSLKSAFSTSVGQGKSIEFGLIADQQDYRTGSYTIRLGILDTYNAGTLEAWMIQPFLIFTDQLSNKFNYTLGLRYNHFTWTGESSIEPRVVFSYNISDASGIYARYGLHTMQQSTSVYFSTLKDSFGLLYTPNTGLGFSRSQNIAIGYNMNAGNKIQFHSELYYQQIDQIPVEVTPSSFSVINLLEQNTSRELINEGLATNYGIELEVKRNYNQDFYYLTGGSLYSSTYKASDGIMRDARYNGQYTVHFTGGKEFRKDKGSHTRTFEANIKILYLGGFRDTPIREFVSFVSGKTVYRETQAFEIKLNDYARLDVRVAWTKNKKSYTRIVSIDIQNLLNIQNDAYYYYDIFQRETVLNKQLGIIPVISYRIEF